MRNLTERKEVLVQELRLVGTDESETFNQTTELIENKSVYKPSEAHNPYVMARPATALSQSWKNKCTIKKYVYWV